MLWIESAGTVYRNKMRINFRKDALLIVSNVIPNYSELKDLLMIMIFRLPGGTISLFSSSRVSFSLVVSTWSWHSR